MKTDQGTVEMMELPDPIPGPRDIVIETTLATICGSDLHFLDDVPSEAIEYFAPGSLIEEGLPMGHEAVGVVREVGEEVTRFQEGDRVIPGSLTACGRCDDCIRGDQNICSGGGKLLFGSQAEAFLVPNGELVVAKVPEEVSDEQAIFATDVMSVAFAAIERAQPPFGSSVAIFAQGPVGLCVTAAARVRGCGLVIACDTIPERLAVSKQMGANVVLNPGETDVVEEIMNLTGGRGVDLAVEAVGTQATFEACTQVVRRGGSISSVGIYSTTPDLTMSTQSPSFLHRQILTTLAPTGRPRLEALLALLEHGDLDFSPLMTHPMSLEEAPAAYELFRSRAEGVIKVALRPE